VSGHPIELAAPELAPWRAGTAGLDYVHVLESGAPGPAVMVQALTHGNEYCGAIALDYLLREGVKPRAGRLTLAFANVAAYARFDPAMPERSRYIDEDYNRVWADDALAGSRDSSELRRARELRPFVDACDYLLDLHSMHEPCRPIMVCGVAGKGGEKAVELSRRMGVPGDLLLDTGHPAGLRMIERGAFGDPASERTAILIECGQHWEARAADVAIDTTLRFLVAVGAVEEAWARPRYRLKRSGEQRLVRVTEPVVAKTMDFQFARPWKGLEVVAKAGTPVARDRDTEWRTPYDDCVMVMPSMSQLKPGTTMVRLGRFAGR
jgi:predicted deacylase